MPEKNQPHESEPKNNDGGCPVGVYGMAMKPPVPSHTKDKRNGPNSSQRGQTLLRLVRVRSLLSIEFPRPGNLGEAARAAPRQAEPAHEAIQFWSLRSKS
jgi:hypothetical protein